jgi:hypothetical protein
VPYCETLWAGTENNGWHQVLYTDCDNSGGMSGGPLYFKTAQDGYWVLTGIIIGGNPAPSVEGAPNMLRRVTPTYSNILYTAREQWP